MILCVYKYTDITVILQSTLTIYFLCSIIKMHLFRFNQVKTEDQDVWSFFYTADVKWTTDLL